MEAKRNPQFLDFVDWMLADALQYVAQVASRIELL
jgi:hypothetical protein